jgi:hypothetical protein
METPMLKHFAAAATLGLAVLFGAIGPAAADSGHHWSRHHAPYAYPYADEAPAYVTRRPYARPNIHLDQETESVWRSLRPEWFD